MSEIKWVKTDGLSLRSEPRVARETYLRSLDIGSKIHVLPEIQTAGWVKIHSEDGQSNPDGYVAARFLRDAENPAVEKLLSEIYKQWFRFDRGRGKEDQEPYASYVGEMWELLGYPDRTGHDSEIYWSAAFTSFIVKKAGYTKFDFSQRHSEFINDAINKKMVGQDASFWGYRLREHKPKLGDIVCQWRGKNKIDFDYAEDHRKYSSHTDVIVEVKEDTVRAIGGNVNNSVSMKTYHLDDNGYLRKQNRTFAILRNNS